MIPNFNEEITVQNPGKEQPNKFPKVNSDVDGSNDEKTDEEDWECLLCIDNLVEAEPPEADSLPVAEILITEVPLPTEIQLIEPPSQETSKTETNSHDTSSFNEQSDQQSESLDLVKYEITMTDNFDSDQLALKLLKLPNFQKKLYEIRQKYIYKPPFAQICLVPDKIGSNNR